MILQDICPFINDLLTGAVLDLLREHFVVLDDLEQLVSQVILRALIVILDNRRAHLGRRDGEDLADHPIGTAPEAAEAHEIHVFIGDPAEETQYMFDFEGLCAGLAEVGLNARNALFLVIVRLRGTTTVLGLLATACNILTAGQHLTPTDLALPLGQILMHIFLDEQLGASDAHAAQDVLDHRQELDVIDRPRELIVSEMTGTTMIGLTT